MLAKCICIFVCNAYAGGMIDTGIANDISLGGLTPQEIAAMESGLRLAGVSVAELCRRAEVAQTTWARLKSGATGGSRRRTSQSLRRAYSSIMAEHVPPSSQQETAA